MGETALHPRAFAELLAHCSMVHGRYKRMKYQRQWLWRYQLYQPDDDALRQFMAAPYLINYAEITADIPFASSDARDAADEFPHAHIVRPWHNRSHGVRVSEGTRYDAPRGARRNFVQYRRAWGKITGECDVLHVECRVSSAAACRAMDVCTVEELLTFKHREFWNKHLREVYSIDLDRLGRLVRNKIEGTKRKVSEIVEWIEGIDTNVDVKTGSIVARSCAINEPMLGPCITQDLVDEMGLEFVRPALVRRDVGDLVAYMIEPQS
jgi:hypothetical protein